MHFSQHEAMNVSDRKGELWIGREVWIANQTQDTVLIFGLKV